MNKLILSTLISTALICSTANASTEQCQGQLYGINNKGTPKIFQLEPTTRTATAHSHAISTSAALAFNAIENRLYYVTNKQHGPSQLIYVDMLTKQHTVVGETKHVYRLTFSPDGSTLYGSRGKELYTVNIDTGVATLLGELSGLNLKVDTKMGDIAFVDGELYLISKKRIFKIDLNNLQVEFIAKHKLHHVNGAETSADNKLILAKTRGHKTKLYQYNLATKQRTFIAKVPARINDLTLDTVNDCLPPDPIIVTEITTDKTQVDEGDYVDFTVTLSGATEQPTSLNLGYADNGTIVKVDYSSLLAVSYDNGNTWPGIIDVNRLGSLPLPIGTSEVKLRALTLVDHVTDPNEQLELQAWMDTNQQDFSSAAVDIIDRAEDPTLAGQYISDMVTDITTIEEGESTTSVISLIRETDRNTPMHIQFINGTAKKDIDINTTVQISYSDGNFDYLYNLDLLDFKVLNLPAGIDQLSVTYQALEDEVIDCNEKFDFAAWIVGRGTDYFKQAIDITDPSPDCHIEPSLTEFSLSLLNSPVEEGQDAQMQITLDQILWDDATVSITTQAGTADSEDFNFNNQAIMIPAGIQSVEFNISTIDDTEYEGNENFSVNASAGDNTTGADSVEVEIIDNDPLPVANLTLEVVTPSVTEGQQVQLIVHLSQALEQDATISLSTIAGSANSSDYTFVDQTVTIAAGSTSYTVNIPTTDDNVFEGNEQFTFNLMAGDNTQGDASAVITIIENDVSPIERLRQAAATSQVNWHGSDGCCNGQRIRGIKGHFGGMPHGTIIRFYIKDQLYATRTFNGEGTLYAFGPDSTIWINNGKAVWATATYQGTTVNVRGAHRVQYGSNPWTDCSGGCW